MKNNKIFHILRDLEENHGVLEQVQYLNSFQDLVHLKE
jgi:hypothetical protein